MISFQEYKKLEIQEKLKFWINLPEGSELPDDWSTTDDWPIADHIRAVCKDALDEMASALRAVALENERVGTENDTLRNSVDAVRAEYLQRVFDEKARADQLKAERRS